MKLKYSYLALILCLIFSQSCSDGYEHYDGIYMSSTLGNNPMVTVIVDDVFPKELDITVASTTLVDEDVTVELKADPAMVAAYNKKFGTLYEPLPENCYALSQPTAVIQKGNYANTAPIKLNIISSEGMVDGVKYMVPVSIKNVSGGHKVIEASRTIYAATNQIIVEPALHLIGSQYAIAQFWQPGEGVVLPYDVSKLPKVTMEARVFIDEIDASSKLNTIFGLEENFVVRTTSEAGKKGQLELAGGGINNVITADPFPLNAWTHLAVVYDGNETGKGKVTIYVNGEVQASMDVTRTAKEIPMVSLHAQYMQSWDVPGGASGATFVYENAPFWIGKSERARYLHGSVSEAKIWAKALTQAEVKANMCITDPTSNLLIAYWRFNNGGDDEKTFQDLTGHGFDMKLSAGSASWTQNVKCPENY